MESTVDIKHLSRQEKLRIMEAIWEDLSKEGIESPDWHQDILQETEGRFQEGREKSLDWNQAKRELRKRFE